MHVVVIASSWSNDRPFCPSSRCPARWGQPRRHSQLKSRRGTWKDSVAGGQRAMVIAITGSSPCWTSYVPETLDRGKLAALGHRIRCRKDELTTSRRQRVTQRADAGASRRLRRIEAEIRERALLDHGRSRLACSVVPYSVLAVPSPDHRPGGPGCLL